LKRLARTSVYENLAGEKLDEVYIEQQILYLGIERQQWLLLIVTGLGVHDPAA
jgi:hypothetical protein